MATLEECRTALEKLDAKLAANAAQVQQKISLDRAMACTIKDLGAAFRCRLADGRLHDITDGDDPDAKIRLIVTSDDLVSLVDGQLNFAQAWAQGRVSVKASFGDLLKLRTLL
ncbi:SCP2 sterol-binding domain-containing protein [Longispora albida]|uniref:SCP2 sterol-binding domain-containing protein n=1 Tax=Longispora albida TaxID=203523 RepID=UPI000366D1C5|nr:SCP2 sterol-binding domain-containing protein [Longispora albida]